MVNLNFKSAFIECIFSTAFILIILFSVSISIAKGESSIVLEEKLSSDVGKTILVDITLIDKNNDKSWNFRIPDNYLINEQERIKNKQITIEAGYPDLGSMHSAFWENQKYNSDDGRHSLLIHLTNRQFTIERIEEYYQLFEDENYSKLADHEDLLHYKYSHKKYDHRSIFLSKHKGSEPWLFYLCDDEDNKNQFSGCHVSTSFMGIHVSYSLRFDEFENRKEYDQAVRVLLKQFYIE